ncbi:MAG: glycogen synthase GlgA [Candidatus Omnitrophica bacterium]|nr:glycogen synthase GlgA [Candidatus Omnitrophota bacterium]
MRIAFCSSEVFPFAKTGGLADVCGALPLALEHIGEDVVVIMPYYSSIAIDVERGAYHVEEVSAEILSATIGRKTKVYFIKNDHYFKREGLYGNGEGDYEDNLDRFQYFCEKILDALKVVNFKPDVVHCNDWQTALIPVYLKEKLGHDHFFFSTRTVLTIHNLAFQGIFPRDQYPKIGLPDELFKKDGFEFYGKLNLLKAGIIYADEVTTVSQQYAHEIQTKEFGFGLDRVLLSSQDKIHGIINGVDYSIWNPQSDPYIQTNYGKEDVLSGKLANKQHLQKILNLPVRKDVPVLGFVGRISHQKGMDLIFDLMEEMGSFDIQLIIQGIGTDDDHRKLEIKAEKFPDKIALWFEFDEGMAHQIYAGSDFFLMPSTFEPCGLSQMISMRFGTIPIVFKTGGLMDTVEAFKSTEKTGTGFIFKKYKKWDFIKHIILAVKVFHRPQEMMSLIQNVLNEEFTWDKSAYKYSSLYCDLFTRS